MDKNDLPRLPFIIYTPERTGSTTLTRILNCHPELRCSFEPFNPGYAGPAVFMCQTMLRSQGIAAAVSSLWGYSGLNGLKHVWHTDGWPFKGAHELNHWLLVNAARSIILLHRRNLLRRAISGQISIQMGIWFPRTPEEWERVRGHAFAPLDIEALRREIAFEREEFHRVRDLAAGSGKPWCEILYEDFFAARLTMEARMEAVQRLFEFLQVGRVTEQGRLDQMKWLFEPGNTGFQNAALYDRIPNIELVERTLGNPETGFVFEDRAGSGVPVP